MNYDNLTDSELIQLVELEREEEVYQRFQVLSNPTPENSTPNYLALHDAITSQVWGYDDSGKPVLKSGLAGQILEGSSRSTKTWAGVDIIIWLTTEKHKTNGCTINIYRETYNEFKTTLYEDFKRRLDDFDLDNKFKRTDEISSFKIGKSKINLLGDGKHGGGCDYAFFNEAMMIRQEVFNQVQMRCRIFWWMDYNPSFTRHWVFDNVQKRPDVGFLRTTFKDNPFISASELNTILGYEPWQSDSYIVTEDGQLLYNDKPIDEKNQPPPHIANTDAGTADEFMWKCYGLGLRGAMKGVIFPHVTYIKEAPQGLAFTSGLDFGFTSDPSALVDYARRGKNIYLRPLWYAPTETSDEMDAALKYARVSKRTPITADSSDRYTSEKHGTVQMVRELFARGWEIQKVSKTKGIMFWLLDMKRFKIHVIIDTDTEHGKRMYKAIKDEFENYKFKEVNGILINQPIDEWNHFIDACFVGETLITTINGDAKIKDIKIGDKVLTSNGYNAVVNKFNNGVKKVSSYSLLFDTFSLSLRCTSNHKVKTNKGWIEISKLKEGMTVYVTRDLMVKNTSCIKTSDTLVVKTRKCTGLYGNFTTVKENLSTTYITKMETLKTIGLKTWRKLKLLNICLNTLRNAQKKTLNGLKIFGRKVRKQHLNGTSQTLELNGIENTQSSTDLEHGITENQTAINVKKSSQKTMQTQNSAQTHVNLNGEELQRLITKQERAITVVMSGRAISTQKQNVVQKCVLVKIDSNNTSMEQVYDIEVEDKHEYFANSLLVHNCRYAHMAHGQML